MAARKKKTTSRKAPRKRAAAAAAAAGSTDSAGAATETALAEFRERLSRVEAWMGEHAGTPHAAEGTAPIREALDRIERLAQTLAAARAPSPPPPPAQPPLDRQMLWAVTVVLVTVLIAFVFLGAHGTVSGDAVTVVLVGFALYVVLQARPLLALFGRRREPPAF